jgi:hypothetical protein
LAFSLRQNHLKSRYPFDRVPHKFLCCIKATSPALPNSRPANQFQAGISGPAQGQDQAGYAAMACGGAVENEAPVFFFKAFC